MKLEDITNVLCLSCVLMFFCVSSQPICTSGWFGHQCKYQCHCRNTSCDITGACMPPSTCEGGWFGPACQYVDLAYMTENLTELTDGDDTTCNVANTGDRITFPFEESVVFTWLRIHVTDQGSDALRNLTVNFTSSGNSVPCPTWRSHAVDKTILDMHCDLSENITDMTLTGPAVPHLCSVYVSGGRNVALKEPASQDSCFIEASGIVGVCLTADRAVDGNREPRLEYLSCSHTQNTSTWTLTLSRERSVHRYVLYNRAYIMRVRIIGFTLESFDSMNRSVFWYKDREPSAHMAYTVGHSPLPVKKVVVAAHNSENILVLCEVEVFGESICDPHHYGRECEHSCSCANNDACFPSTGACPSGCPAGFFGDSCLSSCPAGTIGNYCNLTCSPNCQPLPNRNTTGCDNNAVCQTQCRPGFGGPSCIPQCSVGKYGIHCNQSCSPNCEPSGQANVSSCNNITGACIKGCPSGFSGAMCGDVCRVGTFGNNCSESCSPNCAASGRADVSSCDIRTGACLKGCQSGFSGAVCQESSPKASVASVSLPMELILGLGALFAVMFVAAFCVRRKGHMQQTTEGAPAAATVE